MTPIHEAIQYFLDKPNDTLDWTTGGVVTVLKRYLEKEKEFVGKIWKASQDRADWVHSSEKYEPPIGQQDFLNQLYPGK